MNDSRIVRCRHCNLNQYEAKNKCCRRCGTKIPGAVVPLPPPEMVYEVEETVISKSRLPFTWWCVAKSITAYRKELGWTQGQLAERADDHLSRAYLSRIEGGKSVSIGCLERIADRMEIPIIWLMEEVKLDRLAELFARRVLLETRGLDEPRRDFVLRGIKSLGAASMRRTG